MNTSPFPGMDPFLEDSAEWGGVHTWLTTAIAEQLGRAMPSDFSVKIEQCVYITSPNEDKREQIVPDVYVIRNPSPVAIQTAPRGTITPAALVEVLNEIEIKDRYIEIRDKQSREVITTIEILSPFNKTPKTVGRAAFLEKRQTVIHSNTHWVEIDLLRAGERPREVTGKSDYYALLKRKGLWGVFEVWYFNLADHMPTIAIPLRQPFADLPLDLQAALDDVYQRGRYANDIDYDAAVPAPRLRSADAAWVKERIADWHNQPTPENA